jgi:hypothetical protein
MHYFDVEARAPPFQKRFFFFKTCSIKKLLSIRTEDGNFGLHSREKAWTTYTCVCTCYHNYSKDTMY